ncbi:MAG: hypothetical protein KDD06_03465, partial [Phaeodactylibacter sp.]|nr:hypothetical protein [Phaeodactylibacter sp.]
LDLSEREDNQTNSSTGLLVLQTKNVSISLSSLASGLIDDPSIQSLIPQVNINPHYALVARLNKRTPTPPYPKTLMGLSLGLDIGLKGLPLVGKLLGNADFQVKDIQFIYATKNLDEADVQAINSLNPPAPLTSQPLDGISTGPAAAGSPGVPPNTAIVLAQGLGFKATILLGPLAPLQINMPARRSSTPAGKGKQQLQQSSQTTGNNTSNSGGPTQQGTGSTTTSPSPPGGDATWIDIQQAIGPV